MFIKKDLRKIPTILADASKDNHKKNDSTDKSSSLIDLCLQRRKAEFRGSVKILCQPSNAPSLCQLKSLSLYDCEISSLQGIGMLESLETLNVGRNPLSALSDDFVKLQHLQVLWLDDCALEGTLPTAICELEQLQELRVSNNKLTAIPPEIQLLQNLRILGLDRNLLATIPAEIQALPNLTHLLLRQNALTQLPEVATTGTKNNTNNCLPRLQILHVSSNQLTSLPATMFQQCRKLTHVYANSNLLTSLDPDVIASLSLLPDLQHVTLAHNVMDNLPSDFWRTFGTPDEDGVCQLKDADADEDSSMNNNSKCTVVLRGNPVVQQFLEKDNDPDNNEDDNNVMADSDPMDTETPMAAETESQTVAAA